MIDTRGCFRKFPASPKKRHRRKTVFASFFNIVTPNFNALGPPTFKHCYTVAEEGCILGLQILLHSMDDFIIVPKMVATQMGFELQVKVRLVRALKVRSG